jgi:hypothetical protein
LVGLVARLTARRMLGLWLDAQLSARHMLGLSLWMVGLVAPFLPFDAEQGDVVQSGAGRRVSRGLSRDGRRERVMDAGRTQLCIGRAKKIKRRRAVLARLVWWRGGTSSGRHT